MKKLFKYLLTLGVAAFSFAACEDEQLEPVNFTISGDSSFNESLEATVKVTGDREAPADILVGIVLDDATTFPSSALSFPATVKIAAGSKEATVTVKIAALQALEGGKEYKAVIAAKVNDVLLTQKVTITFAKPEDPATFRFTADGAFFNNIAMLKVEASKPVKEETLVSIALDEKSTIPAAALTIPELKIAKGEQHGEIAVTLDPEVLEPGKEYTAIFNATIGNEAIGTGTVGFNKPDLNGKWTVIGLGGKWNDGDDIAMTEGADGWYTAEGVTVANNDEFKFRRDAKWDLAYGLAEKGQPELDKEFAVVTTAGCPNIGIAAEGIYSLSVNPNKAVAKIVKTGDLVKEMTLAQIKALIPNKNDEKTVTGIFSFIVTSGSGNYYYAEDETAGFLLFKISAAASLVGKKVSGPMNVTVKNYNGQKEVTKVEFNQADITIADATLPETLLTVSALVADFDKYEAMRIKLAGVTNAVADLAKGDNDISQDGAVIDLYVNPELTKSVPQGSTFDVVATAVYYNTKQEVKIWDESAITNVVVPVKKMTIADINALCTSSTVVPFEGDFTGMYVNYVYSNDHIYLEDETGAIRFYLSGNKDVKVGDKISGVITGKCLLDGNKRPQISVLDWWTNGGKRETASEEEMPKPVTVTSFATMLNNYGSYLFRRATIENVVLQADVKAKDNKVKVTNAAGEEYMVRAAFTVPQTVPAGTTITCTGTVDKSGDTKYLSVFSLSDVTIVAPPAEPELKVVKLWEKLSTESSNWFEAIGGAAGTDFNIAIDNENVYIPAFGGSKKMLAIDIATGRNVTEVNTSTVESVGFDGSIYLACARVVKKNDGTPVLMATNLFQDATETATGRLYIWDEGVDKAPKVKKLQQWSAGRRLGDTWTTYGNYEDCWMIMGTQTGNGFVTFKVPTGDQATLISRLAIDTGDFCSYYPFPGDILNGMFTWRGGTHDDGMAYRNRLMTVNSTEAAIKDSGKHDASLTKLATWMGNYENNNGSGFNYIEFKGKRYAIWVINMADSKTFDLMIKEGATTTPWQTIIDTKAETITADGGFAFRDSIVGGQAVTWKQGTDCAVWSTGNEVYIAVNKVNVGLAVYKMFYE